MRDGAKDFVITGKKRKFYLRRDATTMWLEITIFNVLAGSQAVI
jgi:hypothetical protein